MVQEVKYFKHSFVEDSGISQAEAKGKPHFRDTYRSGKRIKHEKVDGEGDALETTCFSYPPGIIVSTHFDENGKLKQKSYDFPNGDIFANRKVSFDQDGQVVYPIQTEPKQKRLRIMESRTIHPETNLYESLESLAGQEIQITVPKRKELFDIDNERLRKVLKNMGIKVKLVHGPDTDIFQDGFASNLAWIRGNYGVDTITLHPLRGNYGSAMETFQSKKEEIAGLGVNLAYENIDANNRWLTTPEEIAALDLPFTSVTLDLSHLDPSTDLLSLEERIFNKLRVVHLSNVAGNKKHIPYRQGNLPVQEFLGALKSDGYKGDIVFEYAPKHKHQLRTDMAKVREFFG